MSGDVACESWCRSADGVAALPAVTAGRGVCGDSSEGLNVSPGTQSQKVVDNTTECSRKCVHTQVLSTREDGNSSTACEDVGENTAPLPAEKPDSPAGVPTSDTREAQPPANSANNSTDDEYFKPLKKLKMIQLQHEKLQPRKQKPKSQQKDWVPEKSLAGVRSFSISEILNHEPKGKCVAETARIVRPWDTEDEEEGSSRPPSADEMSTGSSSGGSPRPCSSGPGSDISLLTVSRAKGKDGNPLDALFQMTSKTFESLETGTQPDGSGGHLNLFSNKQPPKKKRKSRTAFTNHQIFGLEKRFLYQKYLSPADRDELAQTLGLTNAQVITWFQNRRAKLKRDMEELKKDVHSAAILNDHAVFIRTMTQMGLLKPVTGEAVSLKK